MYTLQNRAVKFIDGGHYWRSRNSLLRTTQYIEIKRTVTNHQKQCINVYQIPFLKLLIHGIFRLVGYTHKTQGWLLSVINLLTKIDQLTKINPIASFKYQGVKFGTQY